jgi:hypothetical protein
MLNTLSANITLQTLSNSGSRYVLEGRCMSNFAQGRIECYTRLTIYICIAEYSWNPNLAWIRSAAACLPQHLCYRPAVFFHLICLIVLSLPQVKIHCAFQKYYLTFFIFLLQNCEIAWVGVCLYIILWLDSIVKRNTNKSSYRGVTCNNTANYMFF